MRISEIHLFNFKGFRGLHKIEGLDRNISEAQNIVLIGGLNGAGKTSFLESLFLCFYGASANKLYPSRGARSENYTSFVAALLNNEIKADGTLSSEMYIEVFLREVELAANFTRDISLRRKWIFSKNYDDVRINDETFDIMENGKRIEELEPSEYEDRIKSILPYNVSQFFFFDGEKIQDFASDTDNEFATSLKDVLGINLYSVLADDLKTVRSRILNDYNRDRDSQVRLAERRCDEETAKQQIEDDKNEITDLSEQINKFEEQSENLRNETRRATRISATSREEYLAKKDSFLEEKEQLEKDYVEQSKDFLPFILTLPLCLEIEEELLHEEKLKSAIAAQKEIEPKIEDIVRAVFEEPLEIKLKFDQKTYYSSRISAVLKKFFLDDEARNIDEAELIHNLSDPDSRKLQSFIRNLKDQNVKILHAKADRLKQIDITLDKIRQTEAKSGDTSDEIQKLLDDVKNIDQEIGKKKQRVEYLIHDIKENERKLEFINRDIANFEKAIKLTALQKKQIDYCEKMQIVIKEFQKKYQAKRTHELESSIKDMWNKLTHKEHFVKDIKVLPDSNFEVKLFDYYNNEIDKTKMSAGEREIYAISLLWALVQVSGKKLPIVIDTPFGRLDSQHRRRLVQYYFPQASHQVILLSQDEEIVGEYYEIIKPCVAKELTIKSEGNLSTVKPGYPFKSKKRVSA